MPELFGARYTRAELHRRVGRLEQVAGVRLVTIGDGLGRGVRVLEFRTGTGFAFDVLVDRELRRRAVRARRAAAQLAVGRRGRRALVLRARRLGLVPRLGRRAWSSPAGWITPWRRARTRRRHFNQPHIRTTVRYGLHGRVGGLPARLAGYGERWDGDECVLWAEGEVLQSAVFGEQLVLRRRIEARVGESRFTLRDQVENVGHTRASHMFLYHCNAGFPVVDDVVGASRPEPRDDHRLRRAGRGVRHAVGPGPRRHRGVLRARAHRRAGGNRPGRPRQPGPGAGRVPGLPHLPAALPHRVADDGRGHVRARHGAEHEPGRGPVRTRGSGASCSGSSPASSAATTWRSARCPGRPPSASSRPG